jgi:hypothetical protein
MLKLMRATPIGGLALLILTLSAGLALAHGAPGIKLAQTSVAAGGTLLISGDALGQEGDVVTIALKGAVFQAELGRVKLVDDLFDDTTFTIPAEAPSGSYVITATNGATQESASSSIELTATSTMTGSDATASPTSPVLLARVRSPIEWTVALGVIVISGLLGSLFVSRRV